MVELLENRNLEKPEAINKVNGYLGSPVLNDRNTRFSNVIPSKPGAVWWLNPEPEQFKKELHFLLAKEDDRGLLWLRIRANAIAHPEKIFEPRLKSNKEVVDIEIAVAGIRYMRDIRSGGTSHNFRRHIECEWEW